MLKRSSQTRIKLDDTKAKGVFTDYDAQYDDESISCYYEPNRCYSDLRYGTGNTDGSGEGDAVSATLYETLSGECGEIL